MAQMKLVNLFAFCRGLASVKRYSMETMSREESVLEHTGFVVLVCYVVGRHLEFTDAQMGKLLTCAACHDVDEVLTGDVARPVKYHDAKTREIFGDITKKGLSRIKSDLGIDVARDHSIAKRDRIGSIVAIADVLAVVYKLWDEVLMRGNLSFVRYARVKEQLSSVGDRVTAEWQDSDDRSFLLSLLDQGAAMAGAVGEKAHPFVVTLREEFQG